MMFQPHIEMMDRKELAELQLAALRSQVERCYSDIPKYKEKFDKIGLKPDHIKTLKDVKHIPFTTKEDLRVTYPFGMFGVDRKDVVRIHASSGTTGKPTVVGYTRYDLDVWSDCVARLCAAAGVTSSDLAQISFGYGLFTGALGLHMGLEKLGCAVVPMSSGNTDKQLMLMEDFNADVLVCTPSYAMFLGEAIRERGIKDRIKLRIGLFGGEGCTDNMRAQIEETSGLFSTDNYGLSEVGGPGMSGECVHRCGLHINEDHYLCEIVDPDTFEPLPFGSKGEMVVTTLSKQCLPVLRYRTKDISRIIDSPCACGRTFARMDKITGRTDDMMIIKGVNVFPSQIETVLLETVQIAPHYQIVLYRKNHVDNIEVKVELLDESLLERYGELEKLRESIQRRMASVLGLDAKITLVEPKTLERFQGKAKRVLDQRHLEEN